MSEFDRRTFLTSTATLAGLAGFAAPAAADVPAGRDPFTYEVTRTEEEWRALLGDAYPILREGRTERQRSSSIWAEARPGRYDCKGCDLTQYTSELKVNLTKGWLFFTASAPNSQLMSQDGPAEMADIQSAFDVSIEVHCRRCGSHQGHILLVDGRVLHCINGASLNFVERLS